MDVTTLPFQGGYLFISQNPGRRRLRAFALGYYASAFQAGKCTNSRRPVRDAIWVVVIGKFRVNKYELALLNEDWLVGPAHVGRAGTDDGLHEFDFAFADFEHVKVGISAGKEQVGDYDAGFAVNKETARRVIKRLKANRGTLSPRFRGLQRAVGFTRGRQCTVFPTIAIGAERNLDGWFLTEHLKIIVG